MKEYKIFILFVFMLTSCIDPYEPKEIIGAQGGQLVVEGIIEYGADLHRIRLTRAINTGSQLGYPRESGAIVEVRDDKNNCYLFEELTDGYYYADSSVFSPEIGKSYQLHFSLSNGEEYESSFQKLNMPKPIDTLWYEVESKLLKLYSRIEVAENPEYFRFDYGGTYQFQAPFEGNDICEVNGGRVPIMVEEKICYLDEQVNLPFNITTTEGIREESNFSPAVINIIPTRQFYLAYSMLVNKHSLTADYFDFLQKIKSQNEVGGSLFDPPPSEIIGNIYQVDDKDVYALGFFSLSATTQKRIFISSSTVSADVRDPLNLVYCDFEFPPLSTELYVIRPFPECCNCLLTPGSTDQKPEFWPN